MDTLASVFPAFAGLQVEPVHDGFAVPPMPIASAAARDRSMQRPRTKGPRSLMRTVVKRPFTKFVTVTWLPKRRVLCAAVMA
jgi:hypothetical protein